MCSSDLPVAPLVDKVVIDTINYSPGRDGRLPELDECAITTSELLQRHLSGAEVVKAFNNIVYTHLGVLARPPGAADRSTLPIAGDRSEAKARASELLNLLGYDALDTGSLRDSWRFERDTPAYCAPYISDPTVTDLQGAVADPGRPADADALQAALAAARRREH